jgi:hypothetical protein
MTDETFLMKNLQPEKVLEKFITNKEQDLDSSALTKQQVAYFNNLKYSEIMDS